MQLKFSVLLCVFLVFLMPASSLAKRVYYSSDGTPMSDSDQPSKTTASQPAKKIMTPADKMTRDAAAAAAAGYALGQTVKVENGIIYKLARDPKTKAYTFKLYRRVIRKKPQAPPPTPQKLPDIRPEDKAKNEALTKEKQAALAAEKARQNALEAEKIKNEQDRLARVEAEKIKIEKDRLAREELEKANMEKARLAREEEQRINAEAEKARIQAEAEARRKVEAEERAEAERQRLEREYNGPMIPGRRLNSGTFAIAAEHSFFNRKTILKSRTVTTATGTVNDTNGVGVKDIFYTDTHVDILKIRYGLTRRLEISVEGGMTFEQLSEISAVEPVYGAGFRLALGQITLGSRTGLYLDLSGRYFSGKITGSFSDPYGYAYDKTSDFQDMEAGFEAGLTVSKLTFYSGISYGMYTEDTVKKQILAPPNFMILSDQLEAQDNIIFKAGAEYRLIPQLVFYLEGQLLYREGLLAGMEYRF